MAQLPLQSMSTQEKLAAMEALWDDLASRPAEVPSPHWHREVLDERHAAVLRGDEPVEDWEIAKSRIRDATK